MLENEKTWTPKVRRLDRCLKRLFDRDPGDSSPEELDRSMDLLDQALELCPDHPLALFEAALVKLLLGRPPAEAVELFERAAAADRAPRKGSETVNDIIRRVAGDMEGVVLFDVDRAFRDGHPDGLIGYEWMVDYCHLSFGARVILMERIADRIHRNWPPAHFRSGAQ